MPSSSARCAQLPRAADKVPFYAALKKFRDYLNGLVAHVDEAELVFPDNTSRRPQEEMEIRRSSTISSLPPSTLTTLLCLDIIYILCCKELDDMQFTIKKSGFNNTLSRSKWSQYIC